MPIFPAAAVAFLALAAGAAPSPAPPPSTPTELVRQFYGAAGHSLSGGLPTDAELEILRPLLSRRLFELFVATREYQAKWMARHPDEPSPDGGPPVVYKPPFADFDYFTGYEDGSTKHQVAEATKETGGRWLVRVRSLPEEGTSPWSTRVAVRVEGKRLVIDDVLYVSADGRTPDGSLTESLSHREED